MMDTSAVVLNLLADMSLAEKIGQVFVFTWRNEAQAQSDLRFYPGGYIRIYSDALSVARQTRAIQQATRIPLIIAADLERGVGGTLSGAVEVVTCMALGATGDEKAAYDAARMIAEESAVMGINVNYAPVLDVNSNSANPVINTRSFGNDPINVARMAVAFAKGLHDGGVASCGKHFPGHGNTNIDSHSLLGSVGGTRIELEAIELLPFRALIEAGVDCIMSAHLLIPAYEPERLPATLSKRIMTTLLREQMGFTGVAVSDALDMGAVAENYPPEVAIPMAINAGCDQLIMPQDNAFAIDVLSRAVASGEVSEDRLNEAVGRILSLKETRGILNAALPDPAKVCLQTQVPANVTRSIEIARQSVTLVKDGGDLPLDRNRTICCVTVSNGGDGRSGFLEPQSFADYLGADGRSVKSFALSSEDAHIAAIKPRLAQTIAESDVVIVAAYVSVRLSSGTIDLSSAMVDMLKTLLRDRDFLLVSFGSPYIIEQLQEATSYLCAYGATQPSQQAMAEVLRGEATPQGILPVTLR